jgi:hypothetical protein
LGTSRRDVDTTVRLLGGLPIATKDPVLNEIQSQISDEIQKWIAQTKNTGEGQKASAYRASSIYQLLNMGQLAKTEKDKIAKFSRDHLAAASDTAEKIIYLFGGADIIYPQIFYPKMNTIVLVGGEEPGALPNVDELYRQKQLLNVVKQIHVAFEDLAKLGYFITSKMQVQLQKMGTSTLLAIELAATGNRILEISPVALTASGEIAPRSIPNRSPIPGVRIQYLSPRRELKTVVYFKKWMGAEDSKPNAPLALLLKNGHFDAAFFKAASYVPHQKPLADLNRLLLENVSSVIQTDDGIPLRFFTEKIAKGTPWNIHQYGFYTKALEALFRAPYLQEDLYKANAKAVCHLNEPIVLAPDQRYRPEEIVKGFEKLWSKKDLCKSLPLSPTDPEWYQWKGLLNFRYGYHSFTDLRKAQSVEMVSYIKHFSSNIIFAYKDKPTNAVQ